MPWFKVDDALATHDKVLAAGNPAMGLWVRAGAWSAQHLTDGEIPLHAVKLLGTKSQAETLVHVGLWLRTSVGYRFHEWHDYQPQREKVEADRAEARKRMQRLREGRRSPDVRANFERTPPARSAEVRNPVPSRPEVVVTSISQSSPQGLNQDGLTRIQQATNGPPEHAAKTAELVLSRASSEVRNPAAYILAAIREEPDAYRYRRGNPTRDTACPDHPGEWGDACRACAIDRRLEGTP